MNRAAFGMWAAVIVFAALLFASVAHASTDPVAA
jgi:hypothetical protein